MNSPRLSYDEWQLADNTTLMGWVNGVEFFDISLSPEGALELRINNVAEGTTLYLGDHISVGRAIVYARKYLDSVC